MCDRDYDVVVIGGAFSGAASALLVRRERPGARVLIVEKSKAFDRKVGEATVEVSASFLARELGLLETLRETQLPKHGLRFWFSGPGATPFYRMTEVGPRETPAEPSFLLERRRFDQQLLDLAVAGGAEVARPASIVDIEFARPLNRVVIRDAAGDREVRAKWVVDASGRGSFLARRLRLRREEPRHPIAAAWARWTRVGDPSDHGLPPVDVDRRLATNHFCGRGFWCWVIALRSGETSIGIVYHKEHFRWQSPEERGGLRERYFDFVRRHPGLGELVADAEPVPGDFMSRGHLPYTTRRYAGPGWALVGDAASFLDPYYSPGLDHAVMSASATARLIEGDLASGGGNGTTTAAVAAHNRMFLQSYERWLTAIYLGKYEIFGDAELTGAAFMMDTALYYLGVFTPTRRDPEKFAVPAFGEPGGVSRAAYRLVRFLNRRLVALARERLLRGVYGRRNEGRRYLVKAPKVGRGGALPLLFSGARIWLSLEWERLLGR